MSGEREIRDTAEALTRLDLPHTEILPLYARLSNQEQNRVFQSHHGRRIVLATNVAETSLTVPGIRYVIDPGTARISRYSFRTKVSACRLNLSRRRRRISVKDAVAVSPLGCVSVSIPSRISCRGLNLPILKFCVPIWLPLFCK